MGVTTEDDLPEHLEQLRQGVHEAVNEAPRQAREEARAEVQRRWKWAVFAAFLVATLVGAAAAAETILLLATQFIVRCP